MQIKQNHLWVNINPQTYFYSLFTQPVMPELAQPFPALETVDGVVITIDDAKLKAIESVVSTKLNAAAVANGYDDIRSAALRASYSGPYQAEGVAFATWMDQAWFDVYAYLAGKDIQTVTFEQVLALVPEFPGVV